MKLILHDLNSSYNEQLFKKSNQILEADGNYFYCQGCFKCWSKHPAECFLNDKLKNVNQILGKAKELIIITKNLYGTYSKNIKNILDRTIGSSIPLLIYRKKELKYIRRYGNNDLLKVLVYGDITEKEKDTFTCMVKRNAINTGYSKAEIFFFDSIDELVQTL